MRPARLVLVVMTVASLTLAGVLSAQQAKPAKPIAHRNVRENFLRNKQPGAPRVTFNDQASVFLGNVEVRAYYFGRGHTNGDAVIYFP